MTWSDSKVRCTTKQKFHFLKRAAGAEICRNLTLMFGDQQWATLGDYIQSALMLSYNGRAVG